MKNWQQKGEIWKLLLLSSFLSYSCHEQSAALSFTLALFLVTNNFFFILLLIPRWFEKVVKIFVSIYHHIQASSSLRFYYIFLWASILQFSMQLLLTVCILRYASIFKLTTSNMKFHESRYASPFFWGLLLFFFSVDVLLFIFDCYYFSS